jgi:hypothetical protein
MQEKKDKKDNKYKFVKEGGGQQRKKTGDRCLITPISYR